MSKQSAHADWCDFSDAEKAAFVSAHERRVGVVSGATVRSLEARLEDRQGEPVCVPDEPASDAVFRPSHYARWAIEPITFISANNLDFLTGNVIKYVMRHDAKNGLEDLRKAARYLDILIGHVEREKAGTPIKVQAV